MARKPRKSEPAPPPPAFVTQAEFARMHSVTRKSVTKWKSKGLVVVNVEGLVDVAKSNALLAQRPPTYRGGVARGARADSAIVASSSARKGNGGIAKARKGNKPADSNQKSAQPGNAAQPVEAAPPTAPEDPNPELGWTTTAAQRVKENYLALQRKQEFELAEGRLVEIETVRGEVERIFSIVRELLLTMPGKLADRLVGLERAAIEEAIRSEVFEALNELCQPETYARAAGAEGSAPGGDAGLSAPAASQPGRVG